MGLRSLFETYRTVLFFLIAGGTAAVFQLCVYVLLSRTLAIPYLTASSIAFVLAVVVSFLLQKFVTFEHTGRTEIPRQFIHFFFLACMNLLANGALMYLLVEQVALHDVLAQMLTMATIAVWSFFLYKHFIFKKSDSTYISRIS
jgi:putative flippase GtrA